MNLTTVVLLVVSTGAIVIFGITVYLHVKKNTFKKIKKEVYQLFLKAEYTFMETSSGQEKMKWVIQQVRLLLPAWAKLFLTDALLEKIVQAWFDMMVDLLKDDKEIFTSEEEK